MRTFRHRIQSAQLTSPDLSAIGQEGLPTTGCSCEQMKSGGGRVRASKPAMQLLERHSAMIANAVNSHAFHASGVVNHYLTRTINATGR